MKKIGDLNHTYIQLPNKGEIFVLDKGEIIDAEAEAMLQALHSRSTGGLRHHLKVLDEKGAGNFMKNFYVGYGHKSIGDCGDTTIFIEEVSLLAAKAIQDFSLYSGQEASTRYVDFSKQEFIDPTNTNEGAEILESQREFYLSAQEPTRELLKKKYPLQKGEKEVIYNKAINARAFDITRSLLPAGASTNLAWHTNLRQAADRVLFLRHHPLEEIREIAQGLEKALQKHHPNSFNHNRHSETEAYQDLISQNYFYHNQNSPREIELDFSKLDFNELEEHMELFNKRPEKTELPKFLGQIGTIDIKYSLDFGSYRDIQRHRALNQRMPLLTSELGFNEWYVENLPEEIKEKLPEHLDRINRGIENLGVSREDTQYLLPIGYNTTNRFTGDLPGIVYMVELRASRFVHPTLQKVAYHIGNEIKTKLGIPLYMDNELGRFDIKRGEQDIVLKD